MKRTRRNVLAYGGSILAGGLLAGCLGDQQQPTTGTETTGDGPTTVDGSTTPAGTDGEIEFLAADATRATDPSVTDEAVETLGHSVTQLGLDLHRELVSSKPGENLLVSPYSASIALAMAWAGARGTTADQMAQALGYPFEQSKLHPTFNALDQRLDGAETKSGATTTARDDKEPFRLATVNALWGQRDFPFREAFLETLAVNYGAGMHLVDFDSQPEAARKRINAWIAEETESKITDLLGPRAITNLTRLVLTNAIYFKANWRDEFDEKQTSDQPFTALDGATASVPLMRQRGRFPYAERDGTQVIELPYAGGTVGMVVLLPPDGRFEQFEQSLDAEQLRTYTSALETQSGTIAFPRFSYDAGASLKQTLSALGMTEAFTTRANFQGMVTDDAERDLFVQDIVQKSHITVDEHGTEAAAATAVAMGTTSAPTEPFEMIVDRPFLYSIRHRATDTALFVGRVVDAGAAQ